MEEKNIKITKNPTKNPQAAKVSLKYFNPKKQFKIPIAISTGIKNILFSCKNIQI